MTTKKRKPPSLPRRLARLGACEEAIEWCGKRTLAVAWSECPRADWMLWLLERCQGWSRPALNAFLLDCMADTLESARKVAGGSALWAQVENAHRLVREAVAGNGDLRAARSAAESAAWSAAWSAESAARSAAWSAESAARSAARSAASAAESAAWSAAWSAASAAESAAWSAESAARSAAQQRLADLLRKHFPKPPKMQPLRTNR